MAEPGLSEGAGGGANSDDALWRIFEIRSQLANCAMRYLQCVVKAGSFRTLDEPSHAIAYAAYPPTRGVLDPEMHRDFLKQQRAAAWGLLVASAGETAAPPDEIDDIAKYVLAKLKQSSAAPPAQRVVLQGDVGFGKSWNLQAVARKLATSAAAQLESRTAPLTAVQFPLRCCLENSTPIRDILLQEIARTRPAEAQWHEENAGKLLDTVLASGNAVLLVDYRPKRESNGLAEKNLTEFADKHPNVGIVVARRVGASFEDNTRWACVELLPFNEGEIRQYRKAYFGDSDRAENLSSLLSKNLQLETIARVPLMLYYLCTYVESGTAAGIGDNNLREWLASLLERVETRSLNSPRASAKACLRGLIYAWPDNNDRPLLEEDETLSQILSLLGKASRKIKKKEFSGTELDEKLLEILPSGEPQRSAARVRKIVEESGVLIETQRGSDITPPEFAFIEAVRIAYAPRRWVRLSAGVALSIVVLIAFLLWRHWAATPSHTVPTVVAVAPVETEKPTQSVRAPLVEFSQTQASHVSADCTFSGSVADGYASVWVLIRQDTGHDYVVQPAARIIGGRWTVNAKCGNPEDRLLNFHVLAIVDPVSPIEQGQKLRELPEGAGIAGPINVTRR